MLSLFRLRSMLEVQVNRQTQLAADINRTLQPIWDLSVTAFVTLDPSTSGLGDYVQSLATRLLLPRQDSRGLVRQLPSGVYVSRASRDGPEQVSILESSGLSPPRSDQRYLYYVVRYVEIALEFRRARADASPDGPPDLKIEVGSHDPDGSSRGEPDQSRIEWDFRARANEVHVTFTDTPLPKWWASNGKIASVPDLENSEVSVAFESVVFPHDVDESSGRALVRSRELLRLDTIFVEYSGRKLMIRASDMKESSGPKGLRRYTIRLTPDIVGRLSK